MIADPDRISRPGLWPSDPDEARALQERLAPEVRTEPLDAGAVRLAAGLDVSYAPDEDRLVAAAVVLSLPGLEVVEAATADAAPAFPYVPGLFAFRELPPLLEAIGRLSVEPDVFVCDGFGLAHPRRFGLACHLGWLLDRPTIGVGKSPFVGRSDEPGAERGARAPLVADDGAEVGCALRTRAGVRPVYVSVGHRADLEGAVDLVLRLTPRYRLPETVRAADHLSRERLKGLSAAEGRAVGP
ncbi:endonuclease V [Nocardiopsis sp. RSe5-2]|uniref:Endonuclease V n=1 Tax=Nocardiopsis endophytica TaxID=3018445 RepID=A0ABT4U7I4_9ACTN|nr:endonuclease V [Nocardiopsis endophytica]MDA2812917.1 endonuclease V [Nocardiopsis endophytica]